MGLVRARDDSCNNAVTHRCVAPDVWPTLSRAMKDLLLTLFHWAVMTATLDAARELGIRDAQENV